MYSFIYESRIKINLWRINYFVALIERFGKTPSWIFWLDVTGIGIGTFDINYSGR